MEEKPRRRWLRFSLSTILIGVGICGAGFGWLASQYRIVQERKSLLVLIQQSRDGAAFFYSRNPKGSISFVRRLMGDAEIVTIDLPDTVTAHEWNRVRDAFPEASMYERPAPMSAGD